MKVKLHYPHEEVPVGVTLHDVQQIGKWYRGTWLHPKGTYKVDIPISSAEVVTEAPVERVYFTTSIDWAPGTWRPIETAPRGGTAILIDTAEGVLLAVPAVSRYDSKDLNCWHGRNGHTQYLYIVANAWQPLPAPIPKD